MLTEWDHRFLNLAHHVGRWSKDQSTQVGCVIIGPHREIRAIGYNGFPRGIDDSPGSIRNERPAKYLWTEHAERNAIYQAARIGLTVMGCTMYVPWFPCMDCARAIVQVGIARLVAIRPNTSDSKWGEQFANAITLLQEAGVKLELSDEAVDSSGGQHD